jgi:N-methylhydantoinase B
VVVPVDPDVCLYDIDAEATAALRAQLATERLGWLEVDADEVAAMFAGGEIDELDVSRRYGVILDAETRAVLPETTRQFREMLGRRMVPFWRQAVA